MKRRELLTSGLAAAGAIAVGLKPSSPSVVVQAVRTDNTPNPRDFRDFFAGRNDAEDRVRIEWREGRKVFYVDVGALPPEKAERYLFEIASRHGMTVVERV